MATLSLLSTTISWTQVSPSGLTSTGSALNAPSWPKTFDRNGTHVIVYQPQLKAWQRYRMLVADTAISISQPGQKPVLGVISWRADTITDVSARTVYVKNIQVLNSRFPSLSPPQEAGMQERVSQIYPTMTFTIGLPRMIASLEKANTPVRSIDSGTQVPTILVSMVPAIVLFVDGKSVLAPIQGTTLQYVVNTNWDLFYDHSDYYLLAGKTWLTSKELPGPWSATLKLPADISKLPPHQNWDDVLKAVPAVPGNAPKVLFTQTPAELLVFKGKPIYERIPGTSLSYAANTESSVFLHQPDNTLYVLISGRWFKAASPRWPMDQCQ
ncbi:hypothetical protein H7849_23595 [Alloacidobacterium dinghuense]|uniref:Uncharacterized protein n=1 Tax=Alloacidobacterium dinghuense TaxID=2763107 RepID=A0A7G8BHE4_9BACT|nr:hypothetical protein [Alloacidobacterium dinghuense]QNI31964.1 hypothetical protein H7849_23595 [Alloacidobacterium dinghuense]